MINTKPIQLNHLFPRLNDELINLLKSISESEWYKDTVCDGWDVKDIFQHLLKDYILLISRKGENIDIPKYQIKDLIIMQISLNSFLI